MRLLYLFNLLFIVSVIRVQAKDYSSCFKRISRRAVINYAPIAEYQRTSINICPQLCIMAAGNGQRTAICRAFTYDLDNHICRLYDNDGHTVPAVVHPVIGTDIFYRKSDEGECSSPQMGTLVESRNSTNENYAVLNSNKDDLKLKLEKSFTQEKEHDISNIREDQFLKKAKALASPIVKMDNIEDVLRSKLRGDDILVPMSMSTTEETVKTTSGALKTDGPLECETSSGYYVVVGNEIVLPIEGGNVRVYNNVEQGDCAKYCSENKGPDGKFVNCRSLNYFPLESKCELYAIMAEPHGSGKLMENEKVIYAEKFCLPETPYVCDDDEIFILHVQQTVRKRKIGRKVAESITDCLRRCLIHEKCRSSVYTTSDRWCDLYDVDVADGNYVRDTVEETVLIENGCRRNGSTPKRKSSFKAKNRSSYKTTKLDDWSNCDFKINGVKVKVRINENGEMETEEC